MAADPTLAQGAYRASKHYDMGQRDAKRRVADMLQKNIKSPPSGTGSEPTKKKKKAKANKKNDNEELVNNTISTEVDGEQKGEGEYKNYTDRTGKKTKRGTGKTYDDIWNTSSDEYKAKYGGNKDKAIADMQAWNDELDNEVNHADTDEGKNELNTDAAIADGATGNSQESNELNVYSLEEQNELINQAIQNGDNATENSLMKNLDDELFNQQNLFAAFDKHTANWTNRSKEQGSIHTPHGYSMSLDKDSKVKDWMMALTQDKNRAVTRDKLDSEGKVVGTEMGFEGPDGEFLNGQQFDDLINSYTVDNESFLAIEELANGFKTAGLESDPKATFDRESARVAVTDIINKGNIQSLKYDANFGGSSFEEDLKKGDLLKGKKYSDFGLAQIGDDDIISEDDELSQEDKDSIVDAYLNSDSDVIQADVKKNLTNYFIEHSRRNWLRGNTEVRARHQMAGGGRAGLLDDYYNYTSFAIDNYQDKEELHMLPNKAGIAAGADGWGEAVYTDYVNQGRPNTSTLTADDWEYNDGQGLP